MSLIKEAVTDIFGKATETSSEEDKTDGPASLSRGDARVGRQTGRSRKRAAIRVLLVEDNAGDTKLVSMMLAEVPGAFHLETCDRLAAGLKRLEEGEIDVVLLDLSLPDSHGLETFERVRSAWPTLPIVVLSNLNDEQRAIDAVEMGAEDYLIKGSVGGGILGRALQFAISRQKKQAARPKEQPNKAAGFIRR